MKAITSVRGVIELYSHLKIPVPVSYIWRNNTYLPRPLFRKMTLKQTVSLVPFVWQLIYIYLVGKSERCLDIILNPRHVDHSDTCQKLHYEHPEAASSTLRPSGSSHVVIYYKSDAELSPPGVECSTAVHITRPHSVVVVTRTKDTPGSNWRGGERRRWCKAIMAASEHKLCLNKCLCILTFSECELPHAH